MDNQGTGSATTPSIQSFLESIRHAKSSNEKDIFAKFKSERANRAEQQKRIEVYKHQAEVQNWQPVFSANEKDRQRRILSLRQNILSLSKNKPQTPPEITKNIITSYTPNTQYELSFLENLSQTLKTLVLDTSKASNWLGLYQRRVKSQGHYWSMAGKKGSSYTQNNERVIATSVG